MFFAALIESSIAFSNSSNVRWPSIWRSTISPVLGTIAIGQSASPKLSSSLFRSRATTPPIFPLAHEVTRSRIGIPASARATLAAVSPAHRVPASAWRTSMKMSTDVRGNCSTNTTLANASEITLLISTDRRSGPGRFRSVTENGAMLYRHCTRALAGSCRWRGWASRGPYTAARTLLFPHSMYAEPSAFFRTPAAIRTGRSSSNRRPSSRMPLSSISFSSFGMCSMSSIAITLRGRPRPPSIRALQVLPDEIRQARERGPLLDQPDRVRGVPHALRVAVHPDEPVLAHEHPDVGEVPDQGDHAPLPPDQAGHLRGGDADDLPAVEPAKLAVRHRELDPHRLVDGQDLREDHVPDPEVPVRVPELHHPRRLLHVQGRGGRRVDVHEPVGGPEVRHPADDDVPGPRDVPAAEGDHAHEAVPLGHDAQAGGIDPAPLVERPRTRLQSVSIQEVARDHNLSTRGRTPVHRVLVSRMRACESGEGLKPLPRGRRPSAESGRTRVPRPPQPRGHNRAQWNSRAHRALKPSRRFPATSTAMASSAEIRAGPFNFETPRRRLLAAATSNHPHFVRNHFDQPNLHLAPYCLTIPGGRTVSVAELRELPQQRVTCVLECAGNGRNRMVPRPEGIPWDDEAVGCATWEGPAVRDVLRLAAPDGGAVDVVFRGADSGPEGGAPRAFERSLPVGVAMCDGPILALRMNGRPIPRSHGAPVRLIVPGWYAVASVKWLREIRYINHPFRGYFQTERYVWDDGRPVREVRPRAILLRPPKGASVKPGVTRLEGRAWASAGVAGVDVQVDDVPWIPARLGNASKRWTWVRC